MHGGGSNGVIGRACMGAFAGAATAVHFLPPAVLTVSVWVWGAGALAALVLSLRFPLAWLAVFALLGALYSVWHIQARLSQSVPAGEVNKVSRVDLEIVSLVQAGPAHRQFQARVLQSRPPGLPQDLLVRWHAPQRHSIYREPQVHSFPDLAPGQRWRMSLLVRPPQGARNPHGYDAERHAMAQGWRAVGSVRGYPEPLASAQTLGWGVRAERLRHDLRAAMRPYVQDKRWGGVMLALALGDQASIAPADWQVFNRSGLTHLVSISGTHVTLLAVLLAGALSWAWRRLAWRGRALAEYCPAQIAAIWIGVAAAGAYCVVAGWGVPAQRTFLMLLVAGACRVSGCRLGASRILVLAAVAVVLHDPWAGLATGFYLSFGAVSVLLAVQEGSGQAPAGGGFWRRRGAIVLAAARLQGMMTLALMPALAPLFHEVSLASLAANAYAIVLMGSVATSLVLGLMLLAAAQAPAAWCEAAAWLAHGVLELTMLPTVWLAAQPLASMPVPAQSPGWTVLALAGVFLMLLPRGFLPRAVAALLLLPALALRPPLLQTGEWDLTALDVGQGSAVLLRTRGHVLLFDAGNMYGPQSDEGSRAIRPLLRASGISRLDALVLSHADMDHVGGARSVLQGVPVRQAFSSFDLDAHLDREERLLGLPRGTVPRPQSAAPCEQGASWDLDGVHFRFWWPPARRDGGFAQAHKEDDKNAISCVLEVRGAHHSALLLGDAGVAQEQAMLAAGLGPVDVVVVGHHGSRTSSGPGLVAGLRASLAISQNGWWNRFGHPHAAVQRRWERSGALFLRTDQWGAVSAQSRPGVLYYSGERDRYARYWQAPAP